MFFKGPISQSGEVLIILSTIHFFFMNLLVKILPHIPAYQIVFFRGLISLGLCSYFLYKKKLNPWKKKRKLLLARGLFGSFALLAYFETLHRLPLGQAVSLQQLAPLFTVILGHLFLGDKAPKLTYFLLCLALLGTFLMKETFESAASFAAAPLFLGIGGAFLAASAYTFIRAIGPGISPLVIMFYFPLMMVPVTLVPIFHHWVWPSLLDSFALIGIGLTTQLAQYFLTMAYQSSKAHHFVIYRYLSLPLSLMAGYFLWEETYSLLSYLGMALIISCSLIHYRFKSKAS